MSDVKQFFAELSETEGDFAGGVSPEISNSDDFSSIEGEASSDEREGQLAVDVYERGAHIIVEAPIAGVQSDDVDIHITNESVTIRGKRHREHTVRDKDYFFQECYWGRFSRSVTLPEQIDADRAQATIKNGVLRIVMPKLRVHDGKKVHIREE